MRFVIGRRFCFLVGRHDDHHKKPSSNDNSVVDCCALTPAEESNLHPLPEEWGTSASPTL